MLISYAFKEWEVWKYHKWWNLSINEQTYMCSTLYYPECLLTKGLHRYTYLRSLTFLNQHALFINIIYKENRSTCIYLYRCWADIFFRLWYKLASNALIHDIYLGFISLSGNKKRSQINTGILLIVGRKNNRIKDRECLLQHG